MTNDFNSWFKEMFIDEAKVALDNRTGVGKLEGTAIPVGEAVDTLYFNIYNSVAETNAILSKLTYVKTALLDYPIYVAYANTHDGNSGNFITITNMGDGVYTIANVYNIAELLYMDVYDGSDGIERYNGWSDRIVGQQEHITAGIRLSTWAPVITDLLGIPIGAENEKIKNVLSITPFTVDGYDRGVSDGKQAEYDAFWDAFQENGNRRQYNWAFYGTNWIDACYAPKYDIIIEGAATNAFAQTGITDTKVTIDISGATNTTGLFSNSVAVATIRKLKVSESTPFAVDTFAWTTALTDITIEGTIGNSIAFPNSNKLTTASVQSIIDHLKELTGAATQTLTFHATVKGNLTDAQKATISAKNWTLS